MAVSKPTYTETGGSVTAPKTTTTPPVSKAPAVIDDKTMTEIKRKADAGLSLYSPTDAKMKAYNDYLASKNPAQPTAPTQPQGTTMQEVGDFARAGADAQYKNQEAMLGQARDQQIADLEKAYADAVANGEISVRDAQEQFRQQSEQINKSAYEQSQVTNLTAEGRGIGNSQQMLGLMAGDNARKNTMINENMTTRDKRVNDIGDRIKALTTQKGLDIATANSNYNYGLAGAKAQSDAQYNQAMFGLKQSDYEAYRNQGFAEKNLGLQNQYTLGQMGKQNEYTLGQMKTQNQYDLTKLSVQQKYTLQTMAKQQGYDLAKMSQAQVYQLAQMATQNKYDVGLQNDAQSHASGMQDDAQKFQGGQNALDRALQASEGAANRANSTANAKLGASGGMSEAEAYALSLQRAGNQFVEGSPEYILAQNQKNDAKAVAKENARINAYERILNAGPPVKPDAGWYNSAKDKAAMDKYKKDKSAWDEANKFINGEKKKK